MICVSCAHHAPLKTIQERKLQNEVAPFCNKGKCDIRNCTPQSAIMKGESLSCDFIYSYMLLSEAREIAEQTNLKRTQAVRFKFCESDESKIAGGLIAAFAIGALAAIF